MPFKSEAQRRYLWAKHPGRAPDILLRARSFDGAQKGNT
jgi:hypothetical protein